jgi:hypothetical protein
MEMTSPIRRDRNPTKMIPLYFFMVLSPIQGPG